MALCNAHYYATRDPLGASGDFTTAPEIDQMFGEMVGACLADCWHRAGKPAEAIYAELGPGRGTLAADALRVLGPIDVHLVETSPALREVQRGRVSGAKFYDRIDDLPKRPMLLVANEFFDALPIRQWVGDEQRLVVVDDDKLAFTATGLIVEDSPSRIAVAAGLAAHLAAHGGVALIIDYGHDRSAPGDTLQAVKDHCFADVLANPGDQDLTSHVDFDALRRAASGSGVRTTDCITQGEWLHRLGIAHRAQGLTAANPDRAETIASALALSLIHI